MSSVVFTIFNFGVCSLLECLLNNDHKLGHVFYGIDTGYAIEKSTKADNNSMA